MINVINLDTWLTRLREKDNEALEHLYLELKRPIFIFILSIVKDYHIAEDILQETFIKVITNSESYEKGSNAKAWIFSIARNISLNQIKSRKREELKEDIIKEDSTLFTEEVESAMEFLRLIEPLESEEREIVALKLSAGLGHKQIAETLNISVINSRAKYSRAIKKLKNIIK